MSHHLLPRGFARITLSLLVLLAAAPALADSPSEAFYLPRAEISDEALKGVIGIAFISSMTGPDQSPSGELPRFVPDGETFRQDGTLVFKELRPVSGWDYDLMSLRKFPVVERRGSYSQVVIDVHTNERAWLREAPWSGKGVGVEFLSFDAKELAWSGIELYHLAPGGQSRLYMAPRPDARAYPLSEKTPPRRNGEPADVHIMKVKGNFMQIGAMVDLDSPLEPLGWVPLTDESGLLLVWPVFADMC